MGIKVYPFFLYLAKPRKGKNLKAAGKHLLVATSKPELFAIQILEHFHLKEYFDFIGGASMDEVRVRKGDVITYVLDTVTLTDVSAAVMVGDREHDILGAKKMGLDSLGVLFGYGDYEELKRVGATYIAETVRDIYPVVFAP